MLERRTPNPVTNIETMTPSHALGNGGRRSKAIDVTLMPDKTPTTAQFGPAYRQNRIHIWEWNFTSLWMAQ